MRTEVYASPFETTVDMDKTNIKLFSKKTNN